MATSAFALAPCSSISNLAQLTQAGICYAGINNSVTFSKFSTNVAPDRQSLVGIMTKYDVVGGDGPIALLGFKFDTSKLNQPGISIVFEAQCDQSCQFNDGFNRVQGHNGNGIFWVNGQTFNAVTNQGYSPIFWPWVSTVSEYAAFTQTTIPGLSPASFEMTVNIVPTGLPSWISLPLAPNCPRP